MIISRYQASERFSDIIKKQLGIKFSEAQLQKKSLSVLQGILSKIQMHFSNRGTDKLFDMAVKNGSITYEKIISQYYDIDGFTNNFLGDPAVLDSLECFKCENVQMAIPPIYQLIFAIISCTYITGQINRMDKRREMLKKARDSVEVKSQDKDEKPRNDNIIDFTLGTEV